MNRLAVPAVWLLGVWVAGCGAASPAAQPQPTRPVLMNRQSAGPRVPASVALAVSRLGQAYSTSNWQLVRGEVPNRQLATSLVRQMQRWQRDDVRVLHVGLAYLKFVGAGRYVGTVEFAGDARVPPYFVILIFDGRGKTATILGTTTGIQGRYFTSASWSVTRSAHFLIYHSPYQLAGSDRAVLTTLEQQRAIFAQKFGVRLAPLTAYYLYPDQQLMSQMTTGACGSQPENIGCANPYTHPPSIQASTWPTYHEPIHIYELSLEPTKVIHGDVFVAPLFIGEGTAVALEDKEVDPRLSDYCAGLSLSYVPLDDCARTAVTQVRPMGLLSDKGFNAADPGYAYSLAGSFVKYLILRYGYRTFGDFYYKLAAQPSDTQHDYDVAAEAVYHLPIAQLIHQWNSDLCKNGAC